MQAKQPTEWRHELATKTIRSVPENYWVASMDSWDGAVDHAANARLIAAAPRLLAALVDLVEDFDRSVWTTDPMLVEAREAIALAVES